MCKTCNGKKVKQDKKTLKVEVERGAPHGEQYKIHGEGNEVPDIEAGDVIVQLKQKPHKDFQRKGADLVIEKEIPLIEALTGVEFKFVHLDGRVICVKSGKGEVIKHDDIKVIEGMGMPFHKKTYQSGNLFVHFKVKFPDSLDENCMATLQKALPGPTKKKADQEKEDETVCLVKFESWHKNATASGEEPEEDEDEDPRG